MRPAPGHGVEDLNKTRQNCQATHLTRWAATDTFSARGGGVAIAQRPRVVDWFELVIAARRLARAEQPWVSASEASEYGLDLLAVAEFDGLTEQQRHILLMHGEMWLTRPRWDRNELIALLGKQLETYRLFGLPNPVDLELAGVIGELRGLAV